MPYRFTFDLTIVPRKFFRELALLIDSRNLHKKTGEVLRNLIKKFRLSEMTGLDVSDILLILEDLVDIYLKNIAYRENFIRTGKRVLFLPHCARKYIDYKCRAEFDPEIPTYRCRKCSDDCQVNQAAEIARGLGYDVYIVPGGSCIPNIIKRFGYDGVVGVACGEEIKLASIFLDRANIAAQAVPLLKNGCSNTKFNLSSLSRILELYSEHSMSGGEIDFCE
ncbi:MAG: DUF116 domain-containing protein [Nitrososphaerota archaeon]